MTIEALIPPYSRPNPYGLLTDEHPASSSGLPVLIDETGEVVNPDDPRVPEVVIVGAKQVPHDFLMEGLSAPLIPEHRAFLVAAHKAGYHLPPCYEVYRREDGTIAGGEDR